VRATWLFTRVDVINLAVITSAILVLVLHHSWPDLAIGTLIASYIIKEGVGILREARQGRQATQTRRCAAGSPRHSHAQLCDTHNMSPISEAPVGYANSVDFRFSAVSL
jgi:Co/Zn/Cd efflux system component